MKSNSSSIIMFAVLALAFAAYNSFFIVDQTQYALKIELGKVKEAYVKPGLYFKWPFITVVYRVDNRLLTYDADPRAIFTKDKKEMTVDNFAKWRVTDPQKFYESVRNVTQAQARLDDVIYSQLREVLGQHTLTEIVSGFEFALGAEAARKAGITLANTEEGEATRRKILETITQNSREAAHSFGIEIVDVRIKRTDLPEANSRAVYGRMEAERRREAKRYRSEGEEEALKVRSTADKEKVELLAAAERTAEEARGRADAEALTIYANAYQKDMAFFKFFRQHEVYREVINENDTILMSTEREFLQNLR